ncbi:MAG: membrane protein insertion efficiency factor YidD [Bacteroidia bacterium]|nr:membrane protein insertion efficiency factor YidD [Bacteroidia bacterium]MCZ2278415.1 membrane protein insertion efficiency factor YidD [Bacteroidia bacterium]
MRRAIVHILVLPIKCYKSFISPFLPGACRFEPTCSEYAVQALKKYGPLKGLYLSFRRVLSCHPWGKHGYDPVP